MRITREAILLFLAMIVLEVVAPLLGAACGALSGWVVGLFVERPIQQFAAHVGVKGLTAWQLGVILGFITAFFKPRMDWVFRRGSGK